MGAESRDASTGSAPHDVCASGAAYEPYVGRWSGLVARKFLDWLAQPPERRWLDVGCGTGALSASILARAAPRELVGIDASAGYVAYAREQVQGRRVLFRGRRCPVAAG